MHIKEKDGIISFIGDVFSANVIMRKIDTNTYVPHIRINNNTDTNEMVAEIYNLKSNPFIHFTTIYSTTRVGLPVAKMPIFNKLVDFILYEIHKNPELISIEKNWNWC